MIKIKNKLFYLNQIKYNIIRFCDYNNEKDILIKLKYSQIIKKIKIITNNIIILELNNENNIILYYYNINLIFIEKIKYFTINKYNIIKIDNNFIIYSYNNNLNGLYFCKNNMKLYNYEIIKLNYDICAIIKKVNNKLLIISKNIIIIFKYLIHNLKFKLTKINEYNMKLNFNKIMLYNNNCIIKRLLHKQK